MIPGADANVIVAADAGAPNGIVVQAMLRAREAGAEHFLIGGPAQLSLRAHGVTVDSPWQRLPWTLPVAIILSLDCSLYSAGSGGTTAPGYPLDDARRAACRDSWAEREDAPREHAPPEPVVAPKAPRTEPHSTT